MSVTAKALWYIEAHLSGDLSLEAVADAAGVSRFHLSRGFGVSVGMSLAAYARGRRLSEAAKALAGGAPAILPVALEAGYASHEAFTRAFRQQFGVTPEQVRSQAGISNLPLQEPIRENPGIAARLPAPRIAQGAAMLVFGLGQRYRCGDTTAGIASQWDRFVPYLGHIPGQRGATAYGVIRDAGGTGEIDYVCGVEVSAFPSRPDGFLRIRIPSATYAVFHHREHVASIAASWKAVWETELSSAGRVAARAPAFERYGPEFDGRTGLGGVELWVPVTA